jgi:phosphatidylserine decarboxylase
MPDSDSITYVDRVSGELCQEQLYCGAMIRLMYGEGFLSRVIGGPLRCAASRCDIVSKLVGWYQKQPWTRKQILPFIEEHGIDVSEFASPVDAFTSFADFFVRTLKPEARPIASGDMCAVIPADGRYYFYDDVSRSGPVDIKGTRFDLVSLLQDEALAQKYQRASMVLARLCPSDYHRFHFPVACVPSESRLINGYLYSVNPIAVRKNLATFWQNKRVITTLQSPTFGDVLCMEIGATSVGTIVQTYSPSRNYAKGQEKGYFAFGGSAMVLLFPEGSVQFDTDLLQATERQLEIRCLMGQSLGLAIA